MLCIVLIQINLERDFSLFELHGEGVDKKPLNVLGINPKTGDITVLRAVNYEEIQKFTVRKKSKTIINKNKKSLSQQFPGKYKERVCVFVALHIR